MTVFAFADKKSEVSSVVTHLNNSPRIFGSITDSNKHKKIVGDHDVKE